MGENRPSEGEWPGNKTLKASYADRERGNIALVDASFLALYLIFIRIEAPLRYPGPGVYRGTLRRAMSDVIKCNVTAVHYTGSEPRTGSLQRFGLDRLVVPLSSLLIARNSPRYFSTFPSALDHRDGGSLIEIRAIRKLPERKIHPAVLNFLVENILTWHVIFVKCISRSEKLRAG